MRPFIVALFIIAHSFTFCCYSLVIQPGTSSYLGHPVAYEQAHLAVEDEQAAAVTNDGVQTGPILLLNGFGMGSFHQHRLMSAILNHSNDDDNDEGKNIRKSTIYGLDYLGQGQSWPKDCQDGMSKAEEGLQYSGELWVHQIIAFIEDVILPQQGGGGGQKVHIVGNSLGGHLAVFVAAARPDLIESVVLLNATPFWGLNLPGWSGHLPAPTIPKAIGRYLFDRIRDIDTIEQFLSSTYANNGAFDRTFMKQIRSCTESGGGHAAFASILWSPPVSVKLANNDAATFDDCLNALETDVLLIFGKDDPWCKPAFARNMIERLTQRPKAFADAGGGGGGATQRYVELSNVGHCPNHEAPTAVAGILSKWVEAIDRQPGTLCLLPKVTEEEPFHETWGEIVAREKRAEEIPLSLVDQLAVSFVKN